MAFGTHVRRALQKQRDKKFADFTFFCQEQRYRIRYLIRPRLDVGRNLLRGNYGEAILPPADFHVEHRTGVAA